MTVSEYDAKFEELSKFSSYLKYNYDENWKARQWESGLKPKIKNAVAAFEIRDYASLVNKCRIVEKNLKEMKEEKEKQKKRMREDDEQDDFEPQDQGNQVFTSEKIRCGNCGIPHGNRPCYLGQKMCFNCGKPGHIILNCPQGKGKKPDRLPTTKGRVFTLSGRETNQSDDLV